MSQDTISQLMDTVQKTANAFFKEGHETNVRPFQPGKG